MRISTPQDLREVMQASFTVSDEQWAAISAPLEPAVVIAGAGSGKTELMSARVVYLVANGLVRPDEVLGLTFTTKATAELAERIRRALAQAGLDAVGEDEERLEPTVATYHSYAALLLREHGLRIGHEPDLRVMADAARYQLAARAIDRHTGPVSTLTEHPATAIGYLLALESAMSEHLVAPAQVRSFHRTERPKFEAQLALHPKSAELKAVLEKAAQREELLDLVEGYRRLKESYGLIDFSDQIARACELARSFPDVGRLEREKYRVVLLDEYQDTSVAQARLLAALFSGPAVEEGRGHPVTAVGDPNQAIYGWRGASVSNIIHFGSYFPSAEGDPVPTYPLTVNRRSDRRILALANELARPLYAAPANASGAVQPLRPKPEAAEGEVRTIVHRAHGDELEWLAAEVRVARERCGSWREVGVLVRTNQHAAEVYDRLSAAGVPVEIVGLGGLLRLPEVAEVVATLALLEDLTANDALLTLLTSPRWAIGPRDLALLGKRSRELATSSRHRAEAPVPLADALQESVSGVDPTEIPSLSDALADPGDLGYSAEARERFALLAAELRHLRANAADPLLDLLRRIIDVTGVDVELASSLSETAAARRDNLELFVKAVADFQAVDGQVTLSALMAWLEAEDDFGQGLDVATPSESDSVKLLTVHRAKGLEFDAVFLVGVLDKRFPNETLRSQWTTRCDVLPIPLRGDAPDLPRLRGPEPDDLKAFREQAIAHQAGEELRVAYVAFTRARHVMWVSSYVWGTPVKALGPSPYQVTTREVLAGWGVEPDGWYVPPEGEDTNPLLAEKVEVPWPVTDRTLEASRRVDAAALVRQAAAGALPEPTLDGRTLEVVDRWDAEIERLLAEAHAATAPVVEVPLPSALSATSLARLRDDAETFARELARPMPRRPSSAARFGTRFHAWVEDRFGQQVLLDPDELPGRADAGIDDDTDLQQVIAAFESGPFALRRPFAIEAPFALVLAGQVVRGRIDAVYAEPGEHLGDDDRYLVVDWKTNSSQTADPLQLAIYRVAWAELMGVPLSSVTAAFHYVRTGETVVPPDLPGRSALEALVTR